MKYTKMHIKTIQNKCWGGSLIWIATLLFTISACSDNAVLTEQQPEQLISKIDGQPIVNIQEVDFYGNERLEKIRENLATNHGRAIVRALNEQVSLSSIQQSPMVAVKDLDSYTNIKGTNTSSSTPEIGSSHLRIHQADGETEDFVLTLRPYQNRSSQTVKGKNGAKQLNASNTYLAYSPDRFYLQDDENGNEKWPVTIPAVSLNDSDDTITVTFDEDGLVSTSLDQNKGNSQSSGETQIVMMDGTSASGANPCLEGPGIDDCDGPGGPGGPGDPGGGGDIEHPELVGVSSPFLSIKTIRLDGTGDGDDASELQMHVNPVPSGGFNSFDRKWEYAFDRKFGEKGLPATFGNGNIFQIIGGLFLFITDNDLFRSIESNSIFSGFNTRTFGLDMRIYETPDVDDELVNYSFTNMRTFAEELPFPPDIEIDYEEVDRTDYFPAVMLNSSTFRILLMEDDKDYPEASGNNRNILAHDVWTFDMADGSYDELYTQIESDDHNNGSSDDLMWHSGVRNITFDNANARANSNGEITAISPDNFMWEFVIQSKIAPFYDSNE